MKDLLSPLASFFHDLLPGWLVLPNLTFVLPHGVYWLGLLLFPPVAMYLVHRSKQHKQDIVTKPIAYLLWIWSGFVGLHRFYLRSTIAGMIYVALFILVLVGNNLATDARKEKSAYDNQYKIAAFMVKRHEKNVARGRSSAAAKLKVAEKKLVAVNARREAANLELARWHSFTGAIFALIVAGLLFDALAIPWLVRRCIEAESGKTASETFEVMERGSKPDERDLIKTPFTRFADSLSGWTGQFVAYWSVLAVFVYYYEVIARYVFNSPTNWAHESMFLMFGMQYLLSGAYALREGAHVRVDVIYEKFSPRTRTIIDIVTSSVFFIFVITLTVTGFLFFTDSFGVMEVSFTEWAIQYWPVKATIAIGGILLLIQGLARLTKDVIYLKSLKTAHKTAQEAS